ncbi:MAG: PAS domain S-box protein [Proteobacteria bacterium]|nr:PAS domain S-box protein [Pseudomonadota bacterium]
MKDQYKTKKQLLDELNDLRKRLSELETSKTPRRRMGEELREDEERYRALFEESRDAIMITTKEGKFVDFNKAAVDLFGYTKKEMAGMDVREFYVSVDDRLRFQKEIAKRGSIIDYEVKLRKKNGKEMDCLFTMAVRTKGKTILGYHGIIRDITEQKRVEELYRTVANSSQVGVYVSQKGKFQFVNPHVLDYSGYTKDELIGRDCLRLVHPEDRKMARRNAIEMLKGKRQAPYEFRVLTKDGRTIWMLETVTTIDYFGERAVLGNAMDITEERGARDKLEEAKLFESSILAAIPHAVIGLESRRIIFANDAVETVFGWKPDELIGKLTRIFYRTNEEYKEIARHFYPVLERQRTYSEEFPCRRKDGGDIICMVSTSRIGEILEERKIVVVYEDITARKRVQAELKQSFERLQMRLEETVNALASMTEKRDPYTAGHQQRVTQLACAIAKEMDLPEEQAKGIMVAATLHDIGKIYEPAEILSKPDLLTDIEFLMMKVHPDVGYEILKNIEFPWPVARIVRQHHERLDGSGYPDGLSGDNILLEARILAVADVVEAMASHRPYRSARGIKEALEEISKNRGILYDPEVVDVCLKLFKKKRFKFEPNSHIELHMR